MLRTFETRDGVSLVADELGPGSGRPVVLLHGGGQTRHAWGATASLLAAVGCCAIAVDLRGHGDSGWSPGGEYEMETFAADVQDIVGALGAPVVLVGASLGGMASMLALGDKPGLPVAGLVLVDIAHRFEAAGTQRILDFMGGAPDGFATPQEANEAVSRYLPHRRPPADTSGIEKNLRLHDGRWQWHWDPKLMGVTGLVLEPTRVAELEARLTTSLAELAIPVLLIRGMISDVVSRPIADEFTALVPHSRVVEVERASHMVAGDDNDRFAASVIGFIDELAATSSRS